MKTNVSNVVLSFAFSYPPLSLLKLPPQLITTSEHQRHHRFCLRLLLKHPDCHALCVLCGHNAMVAGSFKHALGNQTT